MYELVRALTQGSDHIRHDIPCEDHGQVFESESCKIFAVADGHGDTNCPRSQLGSKFACEIAISEMKVFSTDIIDNSWEKRLISPGKDQDSLIRQLITSIVAKWTTAVNEELEENPLSDEEKSGCKRYIDRYDRGERLEHIYGTTLIAGLLTESYLLLIQQGDGRCVVFNADGSTSQPIPWDEDCFANVTTSLCDQDVIQKFRYHVIDLSKNPVIACLMGSDGVEDSFFTMELMDSFYRDLLVYASENGVAGLNKHLDEELPEFSRQGSGDDVTICGIVDIDKVKEFISTFQRDNEIIRKESALKEINDRLKSMNAMGKLDALKSDYEKAAETVRKFEEDYSKAVEKYDSYTSDFQQFNQDEAEGSEIAKVFARLLDVILSGKRAETLKNKITELKIEVEQAKQNLDLSRENLAPVEKEYHDFLEKKIVYEKKKETIEVQLAELRDSEQ